jgi:hypothetical protein
MVLVISVKFRFKTTTFLLPIDSYTFNLLKYEDANSYMFCFFSRKASLSSSPSSSPISSVRIPARGPTHSPSATPPGSPAIQNNPWRSRLHTIKNSFLGSPRFHRRKLQGIPYGNPGNGYSKEVAPPLLTGTGVSGGARSAAIVWRLSLTGLLSNKAHLPGFWFELISFSVVSNQG